MTVSEAESTALRAHLERTRGGPVVCSMCGQDEWARWEVRWVTAIMPSGPDSALVRSRALVLICPQCHRVVAFEQMPFGEPSGGT